MISSVTYDFFDEWCGLEACTDYTCTVATIVVQSETLGGSATDGDSTGEITRGFLTQNKSINFK